MSENFFIATSVALFVVSSILAFLLIDRSDNVKKLSDSLKTLRLSFNELDEQARLIVRTDLELNKAQEELDKRLNGLDALQKISRLISTTLDENEIFQCLNQPILSELGFEKYLLLTPDKTAALETRASHGFPKEGVDAILGHLKENHALMEALKEGKIISSVRRTSPEDYRNLHQFFHVKHFILTGFFAQKDFLGMIFAGNQSDAFSFTEGDEELISILADQIGQAIQNARLFEEVYLARQKLESTVQERTRQLTLALEDLKKISKLKSEFISAVSHELRTPLTSIKGYASILITGKIGDIPEKVKERLEKINKHSDNLVKMINDLLDIARIESGRTEMRFEKHHLSTIVNSVQDLLTPQMKDKNIRFVVQLPPALPPVMMDVSQAERIFINLIGNAVKFTPEGGTITVKAKEDKNKAVISVTDTGVGIKKEDQEKLFNEFFRADNEINQQVKGSGLGLSLAKKITEAHHGSIWVTSESDQGTTFFFTLPFDRQEDASAHDSGEETA